ncbi:unnamed protein product [Phytophthora fragariaefolia]|uniref:Unnamed protein product n=1 Tax=Phytophthora fragariaefolia TaxID=1490495 RepID=A0A9W6XIS4_9STRA|nr:unnamed protein product [Phytophthora fragariaefolia]
MPENWAASEGLNALAISLSSERKWRNVQAVLPESFGLVARVLKDQTQLIQELQQRVDGLERTQTTVVTSDFVTALEEQIRDFRDKIEEKMDELITSTQTQLTNLELQFKSTRIQDEDRLSKLRQDMDQKLMYWQTKLMESEARRAVTMDIADKKIDMVSPESQEGEEVRDVIHGDFDARRVDAWKQFAEKADSARVEEISCALMDTIQRAQEIMLNDVNQLRQLNQAKADALELAQMKHNMVRLDVFKEKKMLCCNVLTVLLCQHNVLSVAESIQHELSALHRIVNEKMTIADVKELLDSQSTLCGLQNAMKEVESAAAGEFATKRQVENISQQVQAMSRQLRSEIYQARYVNGSPSAKQTIQWSSQVVNTNADVFLWQFGSDEVRLLLPGLYHLQAAFFTNYSPSIQVLVNGEPAIRLHSPTDTNEVACSPVIKRLRHSAGNVAGLTVDAFLALPARALVAISYDLDEKAQGFLNLRKL